MKETPGRIHVGKYFCDDFAVRYGFETQRCMIFTDFQLFSAACFQESLRIQAVLKLNETHRHLVHTDYVNFSFERINTT